MSAFFGKFHVAARLFRAKGLSAVVQAAGRLAFSLRRRLRHRVSGLFLRLFGCHARKPCARPRVLYVTSRYEAENGQTARYRIHNLRRALRHRAKTRFEILEDGAADDERMLARYDIVVLMRLAWSDAAARLADTVRRYGGRLVFDIDDVIFLPETLPDFFHAAGCTDETDRAAYARAFDEYHETFLHCGFATVTTPYLKSLMEQNGRRAWVIPNSYNRTQERLARRFVKRKPDGPVLGYLSGTRTHDRDFACALPGIVRLMRENANVRLRVVGHLDTSLLPPEMSPRTEILPFVGWKKLMRLAAQTSVNLAPLDLSNPFCSAKSELKFFEAALLSIPTVASATDTFARCIRDGENGMLVTDTDGWYNALDRLSRDAALRARIADNARRTAQNEYSPAAAAARALAVYREIIG